MDERVRLVARLLEGEKMTVLCREVAISRKTGYKIPGVTATSCLRRWRPPLSTSNRRSRIGALAKSANACCVAFRVRLRFLRAAPFTPCSIDMPRHVPIVMTSAEYDQVKRRATKAGVTVSTLGREAMLAASRKTIKRSKT